jgi:hypothetical protein
MHYALLIYESPEAFESRGDDAESSYVAAWRSYHASLVASGSYVGGDPLKAPAMGTTVRMRAGRRQVQDGPYADTKEQLGGFIILELPSLDAALDWAAKCPAAEYGAIEVRPLASDMKQTIAEGEE